MDRREFNTALGAAALAGLFAAEAQAQQPSAARRPVVGMVVHPDMILLDLKLPIMDGFAFLKVLRSYVRFRFLPVFIMTGVTDEAFLRDVEGAGVTKIFRKGGFEFADMRRAIEAAIQKYKQSP